MVYSRDISNTKNCAHKLRLAMDLGEREPVQGGHSDPVARTRAGGRPKHAPLKLVLHIARFWRTVRHGAPEGARERTRVAQRRDVAQAFSQVLAYPSALYPRKCFEACCTSSHRRLSGDGASPTPSRTNFPKAARASHGMRERVRSDGLRPPVDRPLRGVRRRGSHAGSSPAAPPTRSAPQNLDAGGIVPPPKRQCATRRFRHGPAVLGHMA